MCPAILLFKQKRSSVRRSVATRTSRTTVYVFMPKRNNNSQAAIHKHNNIHFSYLDVPRDLLFKKNLRTERTGARASTTTIYVFLPKRDDNSQATIHEHIQYILFIPRCPLRFVIQNNKKSLRTERTGTRASTTTIYLFLPKRDNNSQATIHKHKNTYFPYLNVPCDFLFKKKEKTEKSLSAERSGTRASTHLFLFHVT
jgi:hypothetical protein